MKYLNIKTQAVIETACECAGENWVKLEDEQPIIKASRKKKKDVIKDEDVRND